MENYLIWSNEHNAWWKPAKQGYTLSIERAGRYSRDEALSICNGANYGWDGDKNDVPDELPILEDIAVNLTGLNGKRWD